MYTICQYSIQYHKPAILVKIQSTVNHASSFMCMFLHALKNKTAALRLVASGFDFQVCNKAHGSAVQWKQSPCHAQTFGYKSRRSLNCDLRRKGLIMLFYLSKSRTVTTEHALYWHRTSCSVEVDRDVGFPK